MDNSKYLTTAECRKQTGIMPKLLRKLCTNGFVDFITTNNRDKYRINIESLYEYINCNDVPVGAYGYIKPGNYAISTEYDLQYATNIDTGEIVDFSNGKILTQSPNAPENGDRKVYYQVFLMKDGVKTPVLAHRFNGRILPNNRNCDEFHHINGNSKDNRPKNLLPVQSGEEHRKCDKLRKENPMEYKKLISSIKKLNNGKYYKIPHPDYKDNEHFTYSLWLTEEGYKCYKQNEELLPEHILSECVELKEGITIGKPREAVV